jgi:hypothetical protein
MEMPEKPVGRPQLSLSVRLKFSSAIFPPIFRYFFRKCSAAPYLELYAMAFLAFSRISASLPFRTF